jgi:transcriptional regulator GlxA family with amidase domain
LAKNNWQKTIGMSNADGKSMNVTVVAFEGCMTSAVYGLLDAFALAARLSPRLSTSRWMDHRIRLATLQGRPVHGFGGFRIEPHCSLEEADESDVVVVPAILGDIEEALVRERALVDWLARLRPGRMPGRNPGQILLASACTGAFLLAEAGVLDGRRVTTNPLYRPMFQARYPSLLLALDERIVEDRMVICAGSTSAVLDLAVHVVDRLGGHDLAVSTAKALSIDRNPGSQRPYLLFIAPRDHGDPSVLRVQDWIEARHDQSISAAAMARVGHMSVRNLNRRFLAATGMAPLDYLRIVRLETAKRLLESDRAPIKQVAERVGYRDVRAFIRAFGKWAGLSPGQYRLRFQTNPL